VPCQADLRFDEVDGPFAAQAAGARMNWNYRGENFLDNTEPYQGAHINETIWIGGDNQTPDVTWVEVGTLAGYTFSGDIWTTPRFYAARGFSGSEADFYPLDTAPVPQQGSTHTQGAYADVDGFHVVIDGAVYKNIANPGPYTTEYEAGFEERGDEAFCSAWANRFFVQKVQSYRASDCHWIQSDHGNLVHQGSGNADGMVWCNAPFTYRGWYNSQISTSSCK
jgi:hypothetical protein